ncbi:MAG TPA: ABC transporter permease, partial [Chitinophagaceae bacterium]|nr:ABC transporter permease [Chitinophagaceae bacterium]
MSNRISKIINISFVQAFQELKANKLRSTLSLTGITIGIFCIIAVFTVLDSLKKNIREQVSTLGSDVIYINRWPWMDEGGEYKWWEYWRRPSMSVNELRAVQNNVQEVGTSTLLLTLNGRSVRYNDNDVSGFTAFAVTRDFEKLQNIEVEDGRYLNTAEVDGGVPSAVIGNELYESLFGGSVNPVGKNVSFLGKNYLIVGRLKKVGQNAAGFNFDNGLIVSFQSIASAIDVKSLNYDPVLMVKAKPGAVVSEMQFEVEGALRAVRKLRPGQANDFAVNKLSQITQRMDLMFGMINAIGAVIGGISLIVGAFGIANIMFVTVKERTRYIGLKKAIGARSAYILIEFLIEAVSLCIIGGLIGILMVWIIALIVSSSGSMQLSLSLQNILIGIFTSAIVGVIA